jgi:hypothetical protein
VCGLRADLIARNAALEELDRRFGDAVREFAELRAESDRLQALYREAQEARRRNEEEAESLRSLRDRLSNELQNLRERVERHASDAERLVRLERDLDEACVAWDRADRERQERAREAEELRAALGREQALRQEETRWREASDSRERDSRAALARAEAAHRTLLERLEGEHLRVTKGYRRRLREARAECSDLRGRLEAAERFREQIGSLHAECTRLEDRARAERQAQLALIEQIEASTHERDRLAMVIMEVQSRFAARRSVLAARLRRARDAGRAAERRHRTEVAELAGALERAWLEGSRREGELGNRIRALEADRERLECDRESERLAYRQQLAEARAERERELMHRRGKLAETVGRIDLGSWGPSAAARGAIDAPERFPLQPEAPGASPDLEVMTNGAGEVPTEAAHRPPDGERARQLAGDPAEGSSLWAGVAPRVIEMVAPDRQPMALPWERRLDWAGSAHGTPEPESDRCGPDAGLSRVGGGDAAARERIGTALHESIVERSRGKVRPESFAIVRLGTWLRRALSSRG